jgi:hypothetical protein
MHHLLQALSRQIQFLVRGLMRLLYKCMQNDYSLAHQKTIKRATNARSPARTQLKQAVTKGA